MITHDLSDMPRPVWIVYERSNGRDGDIPGYSVALESATDKNALRDYLSLRMLPGAYETIHCSSAETAMRIAQWLNRQDEDDGE